MATVQGFFTNQYILYNEHIPCTERSIGQIAAPGLVQFKRRSGGAWVYYNAKIVLLMYVGIQLRTMIPGLFEFNLAYVFRRKYSLYLQKNYYTTMAEHSAERPHGSQWVPKGS